MAGPIKDYELKLAAYQQDLAAYESATKPTKSSKGKSKARDPAEKVEELAPPQEPTPPLPPLPENLDLPAPRMKPGEMENFLKLSAALTLLLGRSITKANVDVGCKLLEEYLLGFRQVSDASEMTTYY